jgi:hypothetical protein
MKIAAFPLLERQNASFNDRTPHLLFEHGNNVHGKHGQQLHRDEYRAAISVEVSAEAKTAALSRGRSFFRKRSNC